MAVYKKSNGRKSQTHLKDMLVSIGSIVRSISYLMGDSILSDEELRELVRHKKTLDNMEGSISSMWERGLDDKDDTVLED